MQFLYKTYFFLQRVLRRIRAPVTLGCRAIVMRDDQLLLVRMTYIGGWYLPGGGVDRGESFATGMRRELEEECGIHAETLKLRGIYLSTSDKRIDHVAVYAVESFSGEPHIIDRHEIAEVKFFSVKALPEGLAAGHRRRVEEYLGSTTTSQLW